MANKNRKKRLLSSAVSVVDPLTLIGIDSPNHSHHSKNKHHKILAKDQSFDVDCRGLKPFTVHNFYVDGTDNTAKCKPVGGSLGDSLLTDMNGRISFKFYYTSGIDKRIDRNISSLAFDVHGDKTFEIRADNSYARFIVSFNSGASVDHNITASDDVWAANKDSHQHKNRNGRR